MDNISINQLRKVIVMSKPIIGIVVTRDYDRKGDKKKEIQFVNSDYLNVIKQAGGNPIIISTASEVSSELVNMLDGLLLVGGEDISEDCYRNNKESSNERDNIEIKLYNDFKKFQKPILGICRGMQVINVAEGGTLRNVDSSLIDHYLEEDGWVNYHEIKIDSDSKIYKMLGQEVYTVSSAHHQQLDEIGKDVRVSAVSKDGMAEAIEIVNEKFIIGFQGHIEKCVNNYDKYRCVFEEFIKEAGNKLSKIKQLPIYKDLKDEFLTKKDIVKGFPQNFCLNKGNNEVEYATTSGTTSDRMQIVRKPNWWIDEYKRTYSNNVKLNRVIEENLHKIIFTTAQCSNLVCFVEKPTMEKRIFNNTLYVNNTFNPWDWTENDIKEIISEINYFKPYYLDADPVYLALFLYLKEKYGIIEDIYMPSIITLSYEFTPENIKKYIKKYFNTDIKNLYGTTEFGYVFLENDEGKMQMCKDLVEVSLYPISKEDNLYTLIITSLKNEYMSLLNYRVGDMVIATDDEVENFNTNMVVSKMAGREKDLLFDRISFSMLDEIVSASTNNILLYQFYFILDDMCYFKYITVDGNEISKEIEELITKKLNDINFNAKIIYEMVTEIKPEMSGKFAIVKKSL